MKNFLKFVVMHTLEAFIIVNEAEVELFFLLELFWEFLCFFSDPMDVGNLISGSSVFSKSSLNIWNFTVHGISQLKPGLENFEHHFSSVGNVVVLIIFDIVFLCNCNEK